MKNIQSYKLFESKTPSLKGLCSKYITNGKYTIDNDIVNSDNNLTVVVYGLNEIPIKFGKVNTMFLESDVSTLINSPEIITHAFNIMRCKNIKSLLDGPKYIGNFYHIMSDLNSLEGISKPLKSEYILNTGWEGKISKVLDLFLPNNSEYSGKSKSGEYIISMDPRSDIMSSYDMIMLFNDYDPLRENNELSLDRLNGFLNEIGKKTVKKIDYWKLI